MVVTTQVEFWIGSKLIRDTSLIIVPRQGEVIKMIDKNGNDIYKTVITIIHEFSPRVAPKVKVYLR